MPVYQTDYKYILNTNFANIIVSPRKYTIHLADYLFVQHIYLC
jgi:hypothetical protein